MDTKIVLIPADDVAAGLRTSKAQLANWRSAGKGPSWVKVAGRVYYLSYIAAGQQLPEHQQLAVSA